MTSTDPAARLRQAADLLGPLSEAEAAIGAAKAGIRKSAKAVKGVRAAYRRAEIAEAELEALRGGIQEWGADPTNVQNMYAQLASRTRQWNEAKAERDRLVELVSAITTFAFARPVSARDRLLRIQELLDAAGFEETA